MSGRIDIDFINCENDVKDIHLFLGPIEADQEQSFFESKETLTLAHFMAEAGIFPSVSQARKNGWNKEVPKGFNQFIVGKKRSMITILNIED